MSYLSDFQKGQLTDLVVQFPDILKQAVADYAKFKIGVENNLFSSSQRNEISQWFRNFPDLWDKIGSNYEYVAGGLISDRRLETKNAADKFVAKIKSNSGGLGFAVTGMIVVGAVAFLGTVAGVVWAIGYVKEQNNISRIIDGVVDGSIPADVLKNAVDDEESDIFSKITGVITALAVGIGLLVLYPMIKK